MPEMNITDFGAAQGRLCTAQIQAVNINRKGTYDSATRIIQRNYMNKRENLLSLLRREGYREIPVEFVLCPSLICEFERQTKSSLQYADYFGFPWRRVQDMKLPDTDLRKYAEYFDPPLADGAEIDLWGVGHETSPNSMHMTRMRHPLKNMTDIEEIKAYPFPDFASADTSHQKAQAEAIKAEGLAALGDMQCTVWETSWYMRSMEELMMDMIEEDEKAEYLFERITDLAILRAESFARAGVDLLMLGDDIGMQSRIMMSEELYCTWIKPRLARVIAAAKSIRPDLIVLYHSCGYVLPFIEHLIDAGVDVLNPIQSECMDFAEVHRLYGDRISFHGTVGTQTTMPFCTPDEVKRAVWNNLDIAGAKGGLFIAPTHMLEPEVPWENILAYVDACREYK